MRHRSGFTLIELLVVLILMGLLVALVAPTLLPRHQDKSDVNALLRSAREVAARRGEVVYLHIDPTGAWRMGGTPTPLATGHVQPCLTVARPVMGAPLRHCGLDGA